MKSRPILFGGEMVRAILDWRKTQTRRVVNFAGHHMHLGRMLCDWSLSSGPYQFTGEEQPWRWTGKSKAVAGDWIADVQTHVDDHCTVPVRQPYGQPGDRLWVREEHFRLGHWEAVTGAKARTRTGRQRWKFVADSAEVLYEAPASFRKGRHHKDPGTVAWHKRLARFMPRAFCRIQLEIVRVRVERLHDISEADALAEGVAASAVESFARVNGVTRPAGFAYRDLWTKINGPGSWDANPWVWVVEFKRVTA